MKEQMASLWAPHETERAPIRILLCEDDYHEARMLVELASAEGKCLVEHVERLSEALERLTEGGIDLVLLDLTLPDCTGEETLRRVQSQFPDIPIIAMTGDGPADLSWRPTQYGAQEYMQKNEISRSLLRRSISYALDRHRAQSALRRSEMHFRTLLENSWDGVVLLSADRRAIYTTPAIERILGYTPEEFFALDPFDLVHPDDRLEVERVYAELISHPRERLVVEYRYRHKDGSWRWLETIGVNLLDDPMVGAIVCNYRDVSERNQAIRALRESERRFRALTERIHDAIVLVGRDGNIIYASPSTEQILGRPVEESIGRSVFARMHPEDRHQVIKGFIEILEQPGAVFEILCRYQHEDGNWRWLEGTARNWLHDSSVRAIVGIYRDVTERYQAEQALRRANDELEQRVAERTAELSAANASLTEQIAVRQRAETILRQRNRELAGLNLITAAISRSLDQDEILETLKRLLVEEVEIDAGRIYLYNSEEDAMVLRLSWGVNADAPEPAADKSPGELLSGNETALAPIDLSPGERQPGQGWLRVPLQFKGAVRGVLHLYRRNGGIFGGDEQRFFNILGKQVGAVLVNAQLYSEVRSSRQELQALSRRLVEVQERERRDIARELHDEVGQLLTGLKMNLEMARRSTPEVTLWRLDEALTHVNRLLSEVRSLSLDLRPAMLDDFGLMPALLWLFERYLSQTQVQVDFKHSGAVGRYPPELETAVYRIVQEALTNVARHAGTNRVAVRLWATPQMLGVQIEDDGAGFNPSAVLLAGGSSGLAGMRERAALLGGLLTIESLAGEGTCITAEFPLEGWEGKRD